MLDSMKNRKQIQNDTYEKTNRVWLLARLGELSESYLSDNAGV